MTMRRLLIVPAAVGAAASGAAADLSYITQVREIYARAGTNEASAAAGDFGIFSEGRSVEYAPGFVEETEAHQVSVLFPEHFVGLGIVIADDGIQGWAGLARSVFDVSFTVDEPTVYTLAGSWFAQVSVHTAPMLYVRLTGPSGVLFNSEIDPEHELGWSAEFETAGVLTPGSEYRLEAVASWHHYSLAGDLAPVQANFVVEMIVPAPGTGALLAAAGALGVRRRR